MSWVWEILPIFHINDDEKIFLISHLISSIRSKFVSLAPSHAAGSISSAIFCDILQWKIVIALRQQL